MRTRTKTRKKSRAGADRSGLPAGVETLLSRGDIAAALRVSLRMLDLMVTTGEYPRPDTTIGRLPRWSQRAHNEWLARRLAKGS